MLDTATRMMQAGETPSVSAVAEAAGVSRATAYRYFPTQDALDIELDREDYWRDISDTAKEFITYLLSYKDERPSATEALTHDYDAFTTT